MLLTGGRGEGMLVLQGLGTDPAAPVCRCRRMQVALPQRGTGTGKGTKTLRWMAVAAAQAQQWAHARCLGCASTCRAQPAPAG